VGFERVTEIEALLDRDEAREGRLWRWYRDGRSDAEWQVANQVKTAPTNARHTIAALTFGVVPGGPSYAEVDGRVIRRWLKTKEMSTDLREALAAQLALLEEVTGRPRAAVRSTHIASQLAATRIAEAQRSPGVYVYSLPIYLRHPVEVDTGRTLLKVGHSAVDVFSRVASQSRTTALPEDPVLLRIYPCDSSARVEAQFHDALSRAGHLRPGITSYAGKEWFLTTVDFLDQVANTLRLEIQVVNKP
jgi:hypothetical protein